MLEYSKCPQCGHSFLTKKDKIYCRKGCKKRASEQRKLERENAGCKTPRKMKFATEAAAEYFFKQARPKYNNKQAYLCPCGWYHNRTDRERK